MCLCCLSCVQWCPVLSLQVYLSGKLLDVSVIIERFPEEVCVMWAYDWGRMEIGMCRDKRKCPDK